jgi:hypothetical protein
METSDGEAAVGDESSSKSAEPPISKHEKNKSAHPVILPNAETLSKHLASMQPSVLLKNSSITVDLDSVGFSTIF